MRFTLPSLTHNLFFPLRLVCVSWRKNCSLCGNFRMLSLSLSLSLSFSPGSPCSARHSSYACSLITYSIQMKRKETQHIRRYRSIYIIKRKKEIEMRCEYHHQRREKNYQKKKKNSFFSDEEEMVLVVLEKREERRK